MFNLKFPSLSEAEDSLSNRIKQDDYTIEELLSQEEMIRYVKSKENDELNVIFNDKNIRKLIDYSTKMPKGDTDEIVYKYPFISCDLLCTDNPYIINKLVEENKEEIYNGQKNKNKNNILIEEGENEKNMNTNEDIPMGNKEKIEDLKIEELIPNSNKISNNEQEKFNNINDKECELDFNNIYKENNNDENINENKINMNDDENLIKDNPPLDDVNKEKEEKDPYLNEMNKHKEKITLGIGPENNENDIINKENNDNNELQININELGLNNQQIFPQEENIRNSLEPKENEQNVLPDTDNIDNYRKLKEQNGNNRYIDLGDIENEPEIITHKKSLTEDNIAVPKHILLPYADEPKTSQELPLTLSNSSGNENENMENINLNDEDELKIPTLDFNNNYTINNLADEAQNDLLDKNLQNNDLNQDKDLFAITYDDDKSYNSNSLMSHNIKVERYSNLNYLLSFLDDNISRDNDILSGYFYKIMTNLFKEKGYFLMNFLFSKNNEALLKKFVKDINKSSSNEFMKNILNFVNDSQLDEENELVVDINNFNFMSSSTPNYLNKKEKFINHCKIELTKLLVNELKDKNLTFEKCDSICQIFTGAFENDDNYFNLVMNNYESFYDIIFSSLVENNKNNKDYNSLLIVKTLINLLIHINSRILKMLGGKFTPIFPEDITNENNINNNYDYDDDKIKNEIENYVGKIIKNIKNSQCGIFKWFNIDSENISSSSVINPAAKDNNDINILNEINNESEIDNPNKAKKPLLDSLNNEDNELKYNIEDLNPVIENENKVNTDNNFEENNLNSPNNEGNDGKAYNTEYNNNPLENRDEGQFTNKDNDINDTENIDKIKYTNSIKIDDNENNNQSDEDEDEEEVKFTNKIKRLPSLPPNQDDFNFPQIDDVNLNENPSNIYRKSSIFDDRNINNSKVFTTTYRRLQKKLGIKRLTQAKFLRTLLDLIVNCYKREIRQNEIEELINVLNKKEVFSNAIKLFFNYEFNNMYQITFNEIIQVVISKCSPKFIVDSLFIYNDMNSTLINNGSQKSNLINKLIDSLINNQNFVYPSQKKSLSPSFPFIIDLLSLINSSENETVINYLKDDENFKKFNEMFVSNINEIYKHKFMYNENNPDGDLNVYDCLNSNPYKIPYINDIISEDLNIYNMYKNNIDYSKDLEQKKKRDENILNCMELKENYSTSLVPFNNEDENKNEDLIIGDSDDTVPLGRSSLRGKLFNMANMDKDFKDDEKGEDTLSEEEEYDNIIEDLPSEGIEQHFVI